MLANNNLRSISPNQQILNSAQLWKKRVSQNDKYQQNQQEIQEQMFNAQQANMQIPNYQIHSNYDQAYSQKNQNYNSRSPMLEENLPQQLTGIIQQPYNGRNLQKINNFSKTQNDLSGARGGIGTQSNSSRMKWYDAQNKINSTQRFNSSARGLQNSSLGTRPKIQRKQGSVAGKQIFSAQSQYSNKMQQNQDQPNIYDIQNVGDPSRNFLNPQVDMNLYDPEMNKNYPQAQFNNGINIMQVLEQQQLQSDFNVQLQPSQMFTQHQINPGSQLPFNNASILQNFQNQGPNESVLSEAQIEQKVFDFLNNIYFGNNQQTGINTMNHPSTSKISFHQQNHEEQNQKTQEIRNLNYNGTSSMQNLNNQQNIQQIVNDAIQQHLGKNQKNANLTFSQFPSQQQTNINQEEIQNAIKDYINQNLNTHLNQNPIQQTQVSDIDQIKFSTFTLGNELKEMRNLISDMQQNNSQKDQEIIKLNMILAEEKKKKDIAIQKINYEINDNMKLKDTSIDSQSAIHQENKKMKQQLIQMQEENEMLTKEARQMRKKIDSQKKQLQTELLDSKNLKKQIKEMESKLQNIPDNLTQLKEQKSQIQSDLEQKFNKDYKKEKAQLQESFNTVKIHLEQANELLKQQNQDLISQKQALEQEVQKALKIHQTNQNLQKNIEKLKQEKNLYQKEKEIMQETIDSLNNTIFKLESQVSQLQMEAQHVNELRILEQKKNEMERSASDLQGKFCQNCVSNYQKLEQKERELNDYIKKSKNYEQSLQSKASIDYEIQDQLNNLKQQLEREKNKREQCEAKLEEIIQERDRLETQVAQLQEKIKLDFREKVESESSQKKQRNTQKSELEIIKELQAHINMLENTKKSQEKQIEELVTQQIQLEYDSQNTQKKSKSEKSEKCKNCQVLEGEIKKLQKQISDKESVIEQMSMKMEKQIIQFMEVQTQVASLQSELSSTKKQCDNYKNQVDQNKDLIEKLMKKKKK